MEGRKEGRRKKGLMYHWKALAVGETGVVVML